MTLSLLLSGQQVLSYYPVTNSNKAERFYMFALVVFNLHLGYSDEYMLHLPRKCLTENIRGSQEYFCKAVS